MTTLHDLNPKSLKLDEESCELTSYIGRSLNLQSHTVQVNQDRRIRVNLAATVEVNILINIDSYGCQFEAIILDFSQRYISY